MRKPLALIFLVLGSLIVLTAGVAGATDHRDEPKVTICHRTHSDTNPYVQITVDVSAVDGQKGADHYGEHQGPIWNDTLKAQHIEWGDIIPSVAPYHQGLNWTEEGIALYNKDCVAVSATTTTTEPTTTTTEKATTTTSEQTTTTTVAETTTTVEEPTTTTGKPGLVPPTSVVNKPLAPAVVAETLPATGANSGVLIIVGVLLILAGLVLAVKYRKDL